MQQQITLGELQSTLQGFFDRNEYAEAVRFLETTAATPGLTGELLGRIHSWLGRIAFYQSDEGTSFHHFQEALRQNPKDHYSMFYRAILLEQRGDTLNAVKHYLESMNQHGKLLHAFDVVYNCMTKLPPDGNSGLGHASVIRRGVDERAPKVSIIILCYNKVEYTERCLASVFAQTEYPNFEVVVVDNASADDTPAFLETYGPRINFIHSASNTGFVGGNNLAAEYASGDFVLFLNNDTEVTRGWLNELVRCMQNNPDCGAVGAKLVYPDGRLQEAGGAIFNDGKGWNYGKFQDPGFPQYNFTREVDYCSGAALMVRRPLFEKLGGFDTRYAPAYYEDTDLCFSIRKLGYKVLYCSYAVVIHFEGATAGKDASSGFKRFQELNEPKFKAKWKAELQRQYPNDGELRLQFSNRSRGKRILIIDDIPPLPDRSSGSLQHYRTVKQMLALGYTVTFVHLAKLAYSDQHAVRHMKELSDQGVEFIWFNYEGWWTLRNSPGLAPLLNELVVSLNLKRRNFDLVYIAFWWIANYFLDLIKAEIPHTPVLIDSVDLHYLREKRQAELTNDPKLASQWQVTKQLELATYAKADCITTVTEDDRTTLQRDLPTKPIFVLTIVHDAQPSTKGFSERQDFLFIGNFNHTPNEDGVLFFAREVFPAIKKELPEVRFIVVGNNPTPKIQALASSDIIVTGWVPEVEPYLQQCRVSIVPLRYGAGVKGKVGETLAHGLPMVSTTVGAEGMGLTHGVHSFITDDPAAFAAHAITLYRDSGLWQRFSDAARTHIGSVYSEAMTRRRLQYITSFETPAALATPRARMFAHPPVVSIILVTYNQFQFTKKCIDSIRAFTTVGHEIIVVDNASTDATLSGLKHYPDIRVIGNTVNRGFPAAVNQGMNAAIGEMVLLLNNDTIVTEGWLERMIAAAQTDPKIGIVGPMSNSVSGPQLDTAAAYKHEKEIPAYARAFAAEHHGIVTPYPRVAFLCTLITKELRAAIGGLDERFSPGNYEDDDYCMRAHLAGFTTVIARDVFIHHFGSKSFLANGKEQYLARLEKNREIFRQKWGADPDTLWRDAREITNRSLVIPLHPSLAVQEFERAKIYLAENDLVRAEPCIESALEAYHTSARTALPIEFSDLLHIGGNIALLNGHVDRAQAIFEEELQLTPNSSQACTGLGEVFLRRSAFAQAKVMFELGVQLNPANTRAAQGLARANEVITHTV